MQNSKSFIPLQFFNSFGTGLLSYPNYERHTVTSSVFEILILLLVAEFHDVHSPGS